MDLVAAYRAAEYHVIAPVPFILRVSEHSPALDTLLGEHAASQWAFVTACNPGSVPLPDAENAARSAGLLAEVAGYTTYPGEGRDAAGGWAEESVLIVGIGRAEAVELGRRWGQAAILAGGRGGPAELVWIL